LQKKAIGVVVILNNSGNNTAPSTSDVPAEIVNLLSEYRDIFQETTTLPPERVVDHAIPLR
jgi:hypothetical protein